MNYTILLPVDFTPQGTKMEGLAKAFSHLADKRFSAFFLRDYIGSGPIHSPSAEVEKLDMKLAMQSDASKLNLELKFLNDQSSLLALAHQSRFADLLLLDPLNQEGVVSLSDLPVDFFEKMHCPLFLSSDMTHEYEEIIFLFDYDLKGLAALKSFHALFGEVSRKKKFTLITVSPEDEPGIFFEKSLVSYLQEVFENVGIHPMSRVNLTENLVSYVTRQKKPLLIIGQSALALLENKSIAKRLMKNETSVYYSNS